MTAGDMQDTRKHTLSGLAEMLAFAARLANIAAPGLTVLLDGPVGAGKTELARATIQSLLAKEGRVEDVPSPTFTLVQTYETEAFEIWHADLYRLSNPDELIELGLEAAFQSAFCLVEWPDRMPSLHSAQRVLAINLAQGAKENERIATLIGAQSDLDALIKAAS